MHLLPVDTLRYILTLCGVEVLHYVRRTSRRALRILNQKHFLVRHFRQYWRHVKPTSRGATKYPGTWRDYTRLYKTWRRQRTAHKRIKSWYYVGPMLSHSHPPSSTPPQATPNLLASLWQSPAVQADLKRWPHDRISVWDFSGKPELAQNYLDLYRYLCRDFEVYREQRTMFGLINFQPNLPKVYRIAPSMVEASKSTRKTRRKEHEQYQQQRKITAKKNRRKVQRRKARRKRTPRDCYRF